MDIFGLDSSQSILNSLRRESLDIQNRLQSINEDSRFVKQVAKHYKTWPVIPNLRCGGWYVDPQDAAKDIAGAYFKSTDGHNNNWSFNLRRPNLHLLPLVSLYPGLIIVDSTRSGKRMPDALSKTLPIWCSVINRAVKLRYPEFYANRRWDTTLYTFPASVSSLEHREIEKRLDTWARSLANSSYELPKLTKCLRPFWITPSTSNFPASSSDVSALVCVSASKHVDTGLDRRQNGFTYVQGSGDDHEEWGMGLTPLLFWENKSRILGASREELPALVKEIVTNSSSSKTRISRIKDTPLHICALVDLNQTPEPCHLYILIHPIEQPIPAEVPKNILYLALPSGKRGQMVFLHNTLPQASRFIRSALHKDPNTQIWIACEDGKDASVGVALCALQGFFDDSGNYLGEGNNDAASKQSLRLRLQWIIASRPEANPSRTTLKRVNEYLMSPPSFRGAVVSSTDK